MIQPGGPSQGASMGMLISATRRDSALDRVKMGGVATWIMPSIRWVMRDFKDRSQREEDLPPGLCLLPWLGFCGSIEGIWGRCCMDPALYSGQRPQSGADDWRLPALALGCTPESPYASAAPDRCLTVDQVLDSPQLRQTRLSMLRGEAVPSCRPCMEREAMEAPVTSSDTSRTLSEAGAYDSLPPGTCLS